MSDLEYRNQRYADDLAIADAADRFLLEYERLIDASEAALLEYEGELRLVNVARISKGVYRVSLNGKEGRLGIDHVNLVIGDRHPTYRSVSFGEYRGEGIGCIQRDGTIRLWRDVDARIATVRLWRDVDAGIATVRPEHDLDATNVRTVAILAALEIVLGSADPRKYARAYARAASACWRCNEPLLVGRSQRLLMGPRCFRIEYGMTQAQAEREEWDPERGAV